MNQVFNTNNDLSKAGSETDYRLGSKVSFEPNFDLNDVDKADLVSKVLAIKTNKSQINKKKSVKETSLMQLSKLIFLIKCLSISTLLNVENFIL